MYRLEFEQAVGHPVSDEEYRKAELVLMNTAAVTGVQHVAYIYNAWGIEAIEILYSLVQERGRLINTVGELKNEITEIRKENRRLREFRDTIIAEAKTLPPEDNRC